MNLSPLSQESGEALLFKPQTYVFSLSERLTWKPRDTYANDIGVTRIRYYYYSNRKIDSRCCIMGYFLSKVAPEERINLVVYNKRDHNFACQTTFNL